jgi:hypothetical protein
LDCTHIQSENNTNCEQNNTKQHTTHERGERERERQRQGTDQEQPRSIGDGCIEQFRHHLSLSFAQRYNLQRSTLSARQITQVVGGVCAGTEQENEGSERLIAAVVVSGRQIERRRVSEDAVVGAAA